MQCLWVPSTGLHLHKSMTDLIFNVAQLLREPTGARRDRNFTEARLPLDDNHTLRNVEGKVRFTRTSTGVYAQVQVAGVVRMECVRSLEEFDQPVDVSFADEFHSMVDVVTGYSLPKPEEEDPFFITEQHLIDLGEVIRAYTLLALPMNPVSPEYRDKPVSYSVESVGFEDEAPAQQEEPVDERLAGLKEWARRNSA
jgi:uncharacterized protein